MARFSSTSLSVPAALAKGVSAWKEKSFAIVIRATERRLTGVDLNKITGASLASVKSESGLEPMGFRLLTTHGPLIAQMVGHGGFTIFPVKAQALRFVINGQVIFAKRATIPPRKPVTVFDNVIEESLPQVTRIYEREMLGAINQLFPNIVIRTSVQS